MSETLPGWHDGTAERFNYRLRDARVPRRIAEFIPPGAHEQEATVRNRDGLLGVPSTRLRTCLAR
jgi:hypothetical protein